MAGLDASGVLVIASLVDTTIGGLLSSLMAVPFKRLLYAIFFAKSLLTCSRACLLALSQKKAVVL